MKTWITILTIVFVILKLVQIFVKNYITNDPMELRKYHTFNGTSTFGVVHGFAWILSTLVGFADAVLCLVYIINKI